jgi:hypothetical protein
VNLVPAVGEQHLDDLPSSDLDGGAHRASTT